jgi:RimJ/RimL family protein N-acetyltransferase
MRPELVSTPRLALEPVSPAVRAGDLSGVRAGSGWPHPDTLDALRTGSPLMWLVSLSRDAVVIGDAGTHGPPDAAGDVEIGFGLAAPYRGQGYGRELVAALSAWLAAQPGVRCLTAETEAGNGAARRSLEAAGFVLEHEAAGRASYLRHN